MRGLTNLTRANLQRANLATADLRRVALIAANLQGADLAAANLQGASLRLAVSGSRFSEVNAFLYPEDYPRFGLPGRLDA